MAALTRGANHNLCDWECHGVSVSRTNVGSPGNLRSQDIHCKTGGPSSRGFLSSLEVEGNSYSQCRNGSPDHPDHPHSMRAGCALQWKQPW